MVEYTSNSGWTYPSKPTSTADFHWRWKYDWSQRHWVLQWYDDATRSWEEVGGYENIEDVYARIAE